MAAVFQFLILLNEVPDDEQVQQILALDGEPEVECAPEEQVGVVWFDRPAPSLADAIVAATLDLERLGLQPCQVQPRYLVTVPEAAARLDRPVEAFRTWLEGTLTERGAPRPYKMRVAGPGAVFVWDDLTPWIRDQLDETVPDDPSIIDVARTALRLRRAAEHATGVEPLIAVLVSPLGKVRRRRAGGRGGAHGSVVAGAGA
jgi:hypothetical protein